jgi:bacterioferritin-associated ferredoxin
MLIDEQVVDDAQNGMRDGNGCLFPAAAAGETSELSRQVGLGARCGMCRLDQRRA